MIIPFFIPHAGCPHQCVFCNQKNITGQIDSLEASSVPQKVKGYLRTDATGEEVQIAFYGGSFTALPVEVQKKYLEATRPFVESGQVKSIRLSTRPDCITKEGLALLKEFRVEIIELGAQSMNDNVLALSGRGHSSADTVNAVKLLREYTFTVGVQLMPGLPGDSAEGFLNTVEAAIALAPDFVRLYPVVVIKGTPLAELYTQGRYAPLPLKEAVSLCGQALLKFKRAGIEVLRTGLQPTEELERPGTVLAGPYHPAFGQLVESSLYLNRMAALLRGSGGAGKDILFLVHPEALSSAIGQKRSNVKALKDRFAVRTVRFRPDRSLPRGTVKLILE
jgi:histone acetyltransferase (RNA polymerase elongator complex component)